MQHTRPALKSMFIRRLIGLAALGAALFAVLGVQLTNLTLAEGAEHRAVAESRLDRTRFLPTYRGRILDRKGRVLAEDRPSWNLAVEYEFISGAWAARRAAKAARGERGATWWSEASAAQRQEAMRPHLAEADAISAGLLDAAARLTKVPRPELDERIDAIKRRVHTRAVAVWDRQRELERSRHADGEGRFVARPIQEQRDAHVLAQDLPDVVAFELQRLADEHPGTLAVEEATHRAYPMSVLEVEVDRSHLPRQLRSSRPQRLRILGVADHLVGDMRDRVWPSDVARRPFLDPDTGRVADLGGYRPGMDRVGARGVEASMESTLRGVRGMVHTRLDTGATDRTDPSPGADVQLTIDIELQALVQAVMDPRLGLMRVQPWQQPHESESEAAAGGVGSDLHGAAVVVEIDSGEILAAVSMPTIAEGLELAPAARERAHIFVNRPFESPYAPGSILKPIVYLGAVAAGAMSRDAHVECRGHYLPNDPTRLRCWIYRERTGFAVHVSRNGGPLDATEAIARSCNIYFYTAAARLGGPRLIEWLRRFGAGAPLDAGLLATLPVSEEGEPRQVGEHGGFLPSRPEALGANELVQIGIGQGPVAWTPVQAANAYATMARGGVRRDAVLVRGRGSSARDVEGPDLDPQALSRALAGLRDVLGAEWGTATRIRYEDGTSDPIVEAEGLRAWGKTGTVQAPPGPDHAWFVGLVGPGDESRPRYAIAVIVEHGRSGGRTAGPVFNQIVLALRRLGYLPPLPAKEPA